jgi:hypothetical protein
MVPDLLIERWLDGVATSAEIADLAQLIDGPQGPALRDDLRLLLLLARRGDAGQRCAGAVRTVLHHRRASTRLRMASGVRKRLRGRRSWVWQVAAAALVLLSVTAGWWWLAAPAVSRDGRSLGGTVFHLVEGEQSTLRWPDGSTVALSGPATAQVIAGRLHLEHGRGTAVVTPQARGAFAITTPHAEVAVLGTRFRMDIAAASVLLVDEGRVTWSGRVVDAGGLALAGPGVPLADQPLNQPPQWNDRRAIGVHRLRVTPPSVRNPQGWGEDATLDLRAADGGERLLRQHRDLARRIIASMQQQQAQGVVVWDACDFSADGTPSVHPQIATSIDLLMEQVRGAGLQVGCGLAVGGSATWDAGDSAMRLAQQIAYARARWDARLFFVLNYHPGGSEVIRRLHQAHPDVLLMPIGADPELHRWSVPLRWGSGARGTGAEIHARSPQAFSAVAVDVADDHQAAALLDDLLRGDLPVIGATWNTPASQRLLDQWRELRRR